MNAGRLDRRVTLQRPARIVAADGSWVSSWEDVATVWATVAQTSTKERIGAPQVLSALYGRMHIRWRSDIAPEWRLLYDGRVWRIAGIRELGRREGLELTVEEEQP